MEAKDLLAISNCYIQDDEKDYVYENILLPLLKKSAEKGNRYLKITNYDSNDNSFKKIKDEHNLKLSGNSLADYCNNNLKILLKSKGFNYSEVSPLYYFEIRW